jgi:hypothetical protein
MKAFEAWILTAHPTKDEGDEWVAPWSLSLPSTAYQTIFKKEPVPTKHCQDREPLLVMIIDRQEFRKIQDENRRLKKELREYNLSRKRGQAAFDRIK